MDYVWAAWLHFSAPKERGKRLNVRWSVFPGVYWPLQGGQRWLPRLFAGELTYSVHGRYARNPRW